MRANSRTLSYDSLLLVTRSLACFCRALGCCVRRLTTLAISVFICPCPKLQYATFSHINVVYELTDSTYVLGHTLAITALQTKVTTGRLLLIRIEDHKEQSCCLSRCAWLVWVFRVFSMVQCVPTAGHCPTILFCIVTRSLACFCRALGCCVRRLTTLAISAFICPCPKLQYAWDSFWHFLTIHPSQGTAQHAHQINEAATLIKQLRKGPYREAWGTCKEPWGFAGSLGCL